MISILPILFYLFILFFIDAFSIIRRLRVLLSFSWGVLVCALLVALNYRYQLLDRVPFLVPLVEELVKFALIFIFLAANKTAFICDSLIYGASIGAGFSLVENLCYTYFLEAQPLVVYLYRGFATSLLHLGTTGFAAAMLVVLCRDRHSSFFARHRLAASVLALTPSVLLHYLHNCFLLDVKISALIVVLGSILGALALFRISRARVHSWMESSLDSESSLLSAFDTGELGNTEAGKLLLSIKEQFQSLVFFDMVVYVKLYLELSLAAKGFLMMKEAELPIPDGTKAEFRSKALELKALRKRIGRTAVYTLSPIIDHRRLDSVIKLFS